MNPYALTVLLRPPERPDCRVADSGYQEIGTDYFLSRAAFRVINCVERMVTGKDA